MKWKKLKSHWLHWTMLKFSAGNFGVFIIKHLNKIVVTMKWYVWRFHPTFSCILSRSRCVYVLRFCALLLFCFLVIFLGHAQQHWFKIEQVHCSTVAIGSNWMVCVFVLGSNEFRMFLSFRLHIQTPVNYVRFLWSFYIETFVRESSDMNCVYVVVGFFLCVCRSRLEMNAKLSLSL